MFLPILGQLAAHGAPPKLAQLRMFLAVILDQSVPFRFGLRAAIYCFTKMRERFVGNVELFVFGPAEMALGFAHGILAGRIAVSSARAAARHAVTNDCLDRH